MNDEQAPAVEPDEWVNPYVTRNTTVKDHSKIRGIIRTRFGTTNYGPLPRKCGVCGRPATYRDDGGWYYCNKHMKSSRAGRKKATGDKTIFFKLEHPGSTEITLETKGHVGIHQDIDFVDIEGQEGK